MNQPRLLGSANTHAKVGAFHEISEWSSGVIESERDVTYHLHVVERINSAYNEHSYRSRRKSQCCSFQDGNHNIASVQLTGLLVALPVDKTVWRQDCCPMVSSATCLVINILDH